MKLFEQIKEIVALPHGWCTIEKAYTLANLVLCEKPQTVVEIGVWSGKSMMPMALACKANGDGMVWGIDPYSGAASVEGQTGDNAHWWGKTITPKIYDEMYEIAKTVIYTYEAAAFCQILRCKSDDLTPFQQIDLLHVDGNHGPQALKDVQRFSPMVPIGGHVVLDDLSWAGGAVSQSVTWLLENGFIELFRVTAPEGNDWAVFKRTI